MNTEQEQALKDARALLTKHFTDVCILVKGDDVNHTTYDGDIQRLLPLLDHTADIFRHHIYEPHLCGS